MGLNASARLGVLYLRAGTSALTDTLLEEPIYRPAWPVSPDRGRKIIKRHFDFCGEKFEMSGRINWHVPDVSTDWHRAFFSYGWLQDVAAIHNDKIASSFAREFINGFTQISKIDRVHPCAWETEVAGERLTHWLYYRHFVLHGGSQAFFARYQRSLIRHIRFLYAQASTEPEALGPNAIKGLITAACVIPSLHCMLHEALGWLDDLIGRDILDDGGHISQSPNHHFAFLKTLIEIQELLESCHIEYDPLTDTIARMGVMLQTFCHGDGRLALFNDNLMEDAAVIARAVEHAGGPFEPQLHAEDTGYAHLQAGNVCTMLRLCSSRDSHPPLGMASLECSDGAERIFVNCGTYIGSSQQWRDAIRQSSAFSTLCADTDADSPASGEIKQTVEEEASEQVANLHYQLLNEVTHHRQIILSSDGQLLKGKDVIDWKEDRLSAEDIPPLTARFHLHPDIRCQPQKGGDYLLKTVSGVQWLFSCSLPQEVRIEESVYLGYYGKPQKTLQLAVRVPINEMNSALRWEVKKLA